MEVKLFEIRDEGTFVVPALAIRLGAETEAENYLLSRAGFGSRVEEQRRYVYLVPLDLNMVQYDPMKWNDRTFLTAHMYIKDNWFKLESGQVIDVSFILGEREQPRRSERLQGDMR